MFRWPVLHRHGKHQRRDVCVSGVTAVSSCCKCPDDPGLILKDAERKLRSVLGDLVLYVNRLRSSEHAQSVHPLDLLILYIFIPMSLSATYPMRTF